MAEDYPQTLIELEERFSAEEACIAYLSVLRWPKGFICPRCGQSKGWPTGRGLIHCAACSHQTSVLSGTIFHGMRTPLTVLFRAVWWLASQKYAASALGLQRVLGVNSYQTAWTFLHKMRQAMARPDRERLSGKVEVGETFIGEVRSGRRGCGALGKSLVLIMAEVTEDYIGRIRLQQIPDTSADSLKEAIRTHVEPGSIIVSNGWKGCDQLKSLGYTCEVARHTNDVGEKLLPSCHRIASWLKRWLMGAHTSTVSHEHLSSYLDDYAFRFNCRDSKSCGKLFYRLLQQCMITDPLPYKLIVRHARSRLPGEHNM